MNITEYVAEQGITVEIIRDRGAQASDDGWEHHAYVLKVSNPQNGASLTTPWTQGHGIEESPVDRPDSVLDCLISDVWSYQLADDFEDWAEDFGYDTDSRKAEKIYQVIASQEPLVVQLLGGQEQFEFVATEIERL